MSINRKEAVTVAVSKNTLKIYISSEEDIKKERLVGRDVFTQP